MTLESAGAARLRVGAVGDPERALGRRLWSENNPADGGNQSATLQALRIAWIARRCGLKGNAARAIAELVFEEARR